MPARASRPLHAALLAGACLALPAAGQLLPEDFGDFTLPKLQPKEGGDTVAETPAGLIPSLPQSLRVSHDGAIHIDTERGTIHYTAKPGTAVQVRGDNGIQIFARDIFADTKKKFLLLRGEVSVYQGAVVHRGQRAVYYYGQKKLETTHLRTGLDPFLLEARGFTAGRDAEGRATYTGRNAGVTTHDFERPNFWFRARETRIHPGERVVFKGLKVYAGETPVFWLPYLSQPLDSELGYHFLPGARSNLGFYWKNTYGLMLGGQGERKEGAWLLSKWHADPYSKRGLGAGLDLLDTRLNGNPNLGWLKLYYINDLAPSTPRSRIPRGKLNEDRYHARLQYRKKIPAFRNSSAYLDANLDWHSDRFYLEDFLPDDFLTDPQPDNTVSLVHRSRYSLLTLLARVRPNDFYQSDVRYPELTWDRVRAPVFGGSFLYETRNSAGLLREYLAAHEAAALRERLASLPAGHPDIAAIQGTLSDRGYLRLASWHEFSKPLTLGGWLHLMPRVGAGFTAYRDRRNGGASFNRSLAFAGLDGSLKFSKRYPHVHSKKWGINEFLHVIQPYFSFSQVSTGDNPPDLLPIDRLTPSTRPPPIHLGRFSAVDDIHDWTILRLGLHNRLLTKRDGGTHQWLTLNTYLDVFLDDPEFQRTYSNLYNDLAWHPLPWARLDLETQFPLLGDGSGFTEIATRATFMPRENMEVSLGFRYLDSHPILNDSWRVNLSFYTRLNERWGFRAHNRWELETGKLELQQYSLHRDFDSWVVSFGLYHRDNPGRDDYGGVLQFTLKEFPGLSLPLRLKTE